MSRGVSRALWRFSVLRLLKGRQVDWRVHPSKISIYLHTDCIARVSWCIRPWCSLQRTERGVEIGLELPLIERHVSIRFWYDYIDFFRECYFFNFLRNYDDSTWKEINSLNRLRLEKQWATSHVFTKALLSFQRRLKSDHSRNSRRGVEEVRTRCETSTNKSCALGLRIHYCQCLEYRSYSPLLDLRAKKSRVGNSSSMWPEKNWKSHHGSNFFIKFCKIVKFVFLRKMRPIWVKLLQRFKSYSCLKISNFAIARA